MCQQGWWHDRLEYLGIPGLLFKLAVGINLPVMLDNLRLGAFQNELCIVPRALWAKQGDDITW